MTDNTSAEDAYMLELAHALTLPYHASWRQCNQTLSERATRGELAVRNQYCHAPRDDDGALAAVMEWLLVRDGAPYLLVLEPRGESILQPHYCCATPGDEPGSLLYAASCSVSKLRLYSKFV
jgi:hypothetical protein